MSTKTIVTFLKAWQGYGVDEVAGFDDDKAKALEDAGIATIGKPKKGKGASSAGAPGAAGQGGSADVGAANGAAAGGAAGSGAGADDTGKP